MPIPSGGAPGILRGRLAPSPTGKLHLGNAFAFLMAWLSIRSRGGTLVLRMEDIDPERSRPEYARGIVGDLAWLGLDWDEGPDKGGPCGPYIQSQRLPFYETLLAALGGKGLVYPCYCTRKELRTLAAAPHVGDEGAPYPGTCRTLTAAQRAVFERQGRCPALRLNVDASLAFLASLSLPMASFSRFSDLIRGPQAFTAADCGGDFALRRSDGVVAYQLAAAADDAAMGITEVMRGEDLLCSTPRQRLLLLLMPHVLPYYASPSSAQRGGDGLPVYAHIPLVYNASGERLAKRHKSLELRALRDAGVVPEAITGYLAFIAGLCERPVRISPDCLMTEFSCRSLALCRPQLPEDIARELAAI